MGLSGGTRQFPQTDQGTASTAAVNPGVDGPEPVQRLAPECPSGLGFYNRLPFLGSLQEAGGLPESGFIFLRVPFTAPWWNVKEGSLATGQVRVAG